MATVELVVKENITMNGVSAKNPNLTTCRNPYLSASLPPISVPTAPVSSKMVSADPAAALDCPKALIQYSGIKVVRPKNIVERLNMATESL